MRLDSYLSEKHRKRRRERRWIFAALAGAAVVLVAAGVLWIILHSPLFRVDRVTVAGNQMVPSDDVTAIAEAAAIRGSLWKAVLGYGNMLAWPGALAASDLAYDPRLASVSLSKDYFSHTITINVAERTPAGIWCFMPKGSAAGGGGTAGAANESCYWFDANGFMFARALDTQGNLIFVVHDLSQADPGLAHGILPAEFAPNLMSVLNALRASGVGVTDIVFKDLSLEEIDVTTSNGPALYFSLRFPSDEDTAVLEHLMGQPGFDRLEYIDFRVANRAYYK